MTANPMHHNDAPGETRTPNLLIRSHSTLSDADLYLYLVTPVRRGRAWPEDVTKRPYPAKRSPRTFPRTRAFLGALILFAILVAMSACGQKVEGSSDLRAYPDSARGVTCYTVHAYNALSCVKTDTLTTGTRK